MTDGVVIETYCLVPYRKKPLCKVAPPLEPAAFNREIVFAFKNGRAMRRAHGGHPFKKLISSIVSACGRSPLGKIASETTWISVPRSGASQPSTDPASDPYPCLTLAHALSEQLGGSAGNLLARRSPLTQKRDVNAGVTNLKLIGPLPSSPTLVLVDDVRTSGATLASCAVFLRDSGYTGNIRAFCVAHDVAESSANEMHPNKTCWLVRWSPDRKRPVAEPLGSWGLP